MEGVYAALAIVGAVTGYGFSKAKKQSTKKYTLTADDIRVTTTAGAVVDGLFQNSAYKLIAYDCLLNKLPSWVRTKAAKTLELYNQSKASGAPPSVAYTNIRLGLLQDRELGNITASQELYFPKREQFYQWFKECIAAGPAGVQPVTPASARMSRSGSESTDRSASQFTDRSRSVSAEPGWGGEESPVPLRLMNLETKRTILQRMGITDRATFGQWAETHRRTNPERVAEIEAIVNEVFPAPSVTIPPPAPAPSVTIPPPAPAPLRITVPETPPETPRPTAATSSAATALRSPAPTGETPLPAPTPAPAPTVTVPPPAPTQGPAPRISLPPQLPSAPAPAPTVTVPAPAPAPAPTVTVPSLAPQLPPPEPGAGLGFETQPPTPVELPGPLPITTAPAPTPAPTVTVPPPTREPVNEQARADLFGRQPAPAVTERQRPSLLSRLRRVTLRAPRGATPKQNAAKATLDQLGITDVATFSTYIQGKSSTEQMDALQNGVIAYPDDADLLLDAMTADETAGTAFAQSSDALKKPIQKAADKARRKRPSALVTAPAAISAMTAAPPTTEEPPVELDQINPMFAPAPAPAPTPGPLPPHMRGLVTPLPSAFVREAPAPSVPVPTPAPSVPVPTPAPSVPVPTPAPLTVPAPPPSQPRTPEEMEAQLNEIAAAGTGLGIVAPPPLPEPQGEVATPLPVSRLTRQQGVRQLVRRTARAVADARKLRILEAEQAANLVQTPEDFQRWKATYGDLPDAKRREILVRLQQRLQGQPQPSPEMQELEDVLNAPTPTPASQASAATASSGEVWTPETAEPPASIPAPPPGPPPAAAPVPPIGLNTTEAKAWLKDNLSVESQTDFRRWMRENLSKVTDRILTTAENAYPPESIPGLGNFRTYYTVLRENQTRTVGTRRQRQGGRKARKNTLRSRRKVDTKNVRRSSYRKNRANRRN